MKWGGRQLHMASLIVLGDLGRADLWRGMGCDVQDVCILFQSDAIDGTACDGLFEESESWDTNNNNESNGSDEDFRGLSDLLKLHNTLPFCSVFVNLIFRCKWIFFSKLFFKNPGASYDPENMYIPSPKEPTKPASKT
jgi:hypothetical protein